jgi:hypothetical protein
MGSDWAWCKRVLFEREWRVAFQIAANKTVFINSELERRGAGVVGSLGSELLSE